MKIAQITNYNQNSKQKTTPLIKKKEMSCGSHLQNKKKNQREKNTNNSKKKTSSQEDFRTSHFTSITYKIKEELCNDWIKISTDFVIDDRSTW